MLDFTTPRTRMTRGYRRWIGVIGLANGWHWLRPAFPAQLGPARPRAHAAAKSSIYREGPDRRDAERRRPGTAPRSPTALRTPHAGESSVAGSGVKSIARPPVALTAQMSSCPERLEVNATRLPSGDHAACVSLARWRTSGRGPAPVAVIVHTSAGAPSPYRVEALRGPSGAQSGSPPPPCRLARLGRG